MQLRALISQLGPVMVAEHLGVDEAALTLLADGQAELDQEAAQNLAHLLSVLGDAVSVAPGADEDLPPLLPPDDGSVNGVECVVTLDLDGDGAADVELAGVGLTPANDRHWADSVEQKRMSLRSARALAMSTQFRLGMDYQETVAALGLVTRIELALIMFFRESVPEPGMEWDGERWAREADKRLARLRWVTREQQREFSGLRGVWNRLRGKGPVSGRDLYERMVSEADLIVSAMSMSEEQTDAVAHLMRQSGLERLLGGRR